MESVALTFFHDPGIILPPLIAVLNDVRRSKIVWFELFWDGENEEHIAEHDLTIEDVEHAVENSIKTHVSRSSGRPMLEGYAQDGRVIMVVFEYLDEITIYPVTAYEVER